MILVEHKKTRSRFAVVGAGYGLAKTSRPSVFFGSLSPAESEEILDVICLCDRAGNLAWCQSHEIRVVSINGVELSTCPDLDSFAHHEDQLGASAVALSEPMRCVSCNEIITTPECPNCEQG